MSGILCLHFGNTIAQMVRSIRVHRSTYIVHACIWHGMAEKRHIHNTKEYSAIHVYNFVRGNVFSDMYRENTNLMRCSTWVCRLCCRVQMYTAQNMFNISLIAQSLPPFCNWCMSRVENFSKLKQPRSHYFPFVQLHSFKCASHTPHNMGFLE